MSHRQHAHAVKIARVQPRDSWNNKPRKSGNLASQSTRSRRGVQHVRFSARAWRRTFRSKNVGSLVKVKKQQTADGYDIQQILAFM